MTKRIHLKKILWIYILAFVLTAFSFHAKASAKAPSLKRPVVAPLVQESAHA